MRKILVIDDHQGIRENIAEILTLAGYDALTAEDGKKGIAAAVREKPDLIVCDIMMPRLDGYGVLHLLKKNPETEHIPFLFLTAKTEKSDFRRGMEMGADDYITKPFEDFELLKAIEIRLKKNDILYQKYEPDTQGATGMLTAGSGYLHIRPEDFESQELPKKSNLYIEGRRPRALYYVKKGKIKCYRANEQGKEYITNFYCEGDYIGYLPILEEKNYEDTAVILEDAELSIIPRESFVNGIYNDLSFAVKFIRLIANNVLERENRMLDLAYSSLRKRVAKALLDIHDKFNSSTGNDTQKHLALTISREDIAQYVGTATESLIRTLSEFKSGQLIDITEGKIRIRDTGRLKNLLY